MPENDAENKSPDAPVKKTLRDHLKALGGAILMVGFTFLLIEIGVRLLDPWGLRYFEDLAKMGNEVFQPDATRGYSIPDGTYPFSHWSATMHNGGRLIPANNPDAACKIIILGDSVAFAYGVNDADSWLNTIAAQMPDVNFQNLAVPRYNSTNVLLTYQAYPDADAYMYLVINNDVTPAIDVVAQEFSGSGAGLPWLVRYANFAMFRGGGTDRDESAAPDNTTLLPDTPDTQRFFSEVDTLMADARMHLAAFGGEALTNSLQARYPATVFDYPRNNRISFADYHLTPKGNAELAAQALPLFQQIADESCSDA